MWIKLKLSHKLAVYSSEIELEVETQLHFFDGLIKLILLYGFEVWWYENVEQIEIFYRNLLRKIFRIIEGAPKAMIYS